MSSPGLGILFGLASALVWGSGDYCGGRAALHGKPVQATFLAALSGLVMLSLAAIARGEALPSLIGAVWAIMAGIAGMLGIAALYGGLAVGNASLVAPTAAVVGAVAPLGVSLFFEGWPSFAQLGGLMLGLIGIWLVSRPAEGTGGTTRRGFGLAILAGISFGSFFVLLAQTEREQIVITLVLAKAAALGAAALWLWMQRSRLPSPTDNPLGLWAGVLDAGGNVLYLLAVNFTRLDVAAVTASMYPATTVLLSALLLRQKISRAQLFGLLLCLSALALLAI